MAKKDLSKFVGCWITCSAPKHEGLYMVFECDQKRYGLKIQRPDEFKAHWVNANTVKLIK